jgi:hypothetical protein
MLLLREHTGPKTAKGRQPLKNAKNGLKSGPAEPNCPSQPLSNGQPPT